MIKVGVPADVLKGLALAADPHKEEGRYNLSRLYVLVREKSSVVLSCCGSMALAYVNDATDYVGEDVAFCFPSYELPAFPKNTGYVYLCWDGPLKPAMQASRIWVEGGGITKEFDVREHERERALSTAQMLLNLFKLEPTLEHAWLNGYYTELLAKIGKVILRPSRDGGAFHTMWTIWMNGAGVVGLRLGEMDLYGVLQPMTYTAPAAKYATDWI